MTQIWRFLYKSIRLVKTINSNLKRKRKLLESSSFLSKNLFLQSISYLLSKMRKRQKCVNVKSTLKVNLVFSYLPCICYFRLHQTHRILILGESIIALWLHCIQLEHICNAYIKAHICHTFWSMIFKLFSLNIQMYSSLIINKNVN